MHHTITFYQYPGYCVCVLFLFYGGSTAKVIVPRSYSKFQEDFADRVAIICLVEQREALTPRGGGGSATVRDVRPATSRHSTPPLPPRACDTQ